MKNRILTLLQRHATTDAHIIGRYKDELLDVVDQESDFAVEAAKALLRVELSTHDLTRISARRATADFDMRLSLYALLSQYGRVGASDLLNLETELNNLTDQRQHFLSIIAMNCKLDWTSPIVVAMVERLATEKSPWHPHIHTLYCLFRYLRHPLLFKLAEHVEANVVEDKLLSAAIKHMMSEVKRDHV